MMDSCVSCLGDRMTRLDRHRGEGGWETGESGFSVRVSAGNELPAQVGVIDESLGKGRPRQRWTVSGKVQQWKAEDAKRTSCPRRRAGEGRGHGRADCCGHLGETLQRGCWENKHLSLLSCCPVTPTTGLFIDQTHLESRRQGAY